MGLKTEIQLLATSHLKSQRWSFETRQSMVNSDQSTAAWRLELLRTMLETARKAVCRSIGYFTWHGQRAMHNLLLQGRNEKFSTCSNHASVTNNKWPRFPNPSDDRMFFVALPS